MSLNCILRLFFSYKSFDLLSLLSEVVGDVFKHGFSAIFSLLKSDKSISLLRS